VAGAVSLHRPRTTIRRPSTILSVLLVAAGLAVAGLGAGAASGASPGVTASLSCPGSAQTGDNVSFDASGSSDDAPGATITSYDFSFGDGNGTGAQGSSSASHSYGSANTYHASVTVADDQGNSDSAGCTVDVTSPPPPNQAPTADFAVSPGSPTAGSTVTMTSASSDPDGDSLTYSWGFDGFPAGSSKSVKWTNVPKGGHTVTLTVDDGHGHQDTKTRTFSASDRPPTAAFTFLPTAPVGGNTITFNGFSSSDPDGDALSYAWDFDSNGTVDATGVTANWVNVPAGAHGVTLTVNDGTTFDSVNKTINVALPPNVMPIADFIIAPNPANVGQTVTFDGASSKDPDLGGIVRYDWTFGDGSKATTTTPSAKHAYASAGSYTATLKVTDNRAGTGTLSSAVKISPTPLPPNRPPTAGFSFSPSAPVAGDTVSFTSTSSDSDGQIKRIDWDFNGDGFYDATGATATHAYPGAGSYDVTLRAQDDRGDLSTVTHRVTVSGAQQASTLAVFGASSLRTIAPFPVVRIRGRLTRHGARILLLTVRAPNGTTVVASCKGRGCPRGKRASQRAIVRRGLVRFRNFERSLRSGTRLVIYVMQQGRIGKYTRFTIRTGKSPSRKDLCVSGRKAIRCPTG
jgi:PKD repeat protein